MEELPDQCLGDDGARGRPGEHLNLTWRVKQDIPEEGTGRGRGPEGKKQGRDGERQGMILSQS